MPTRPQPRSYAIALDLLSVGARALVVGLAAAVSLGGLAMLLAGPARAADELPGELILRSADSDAVWRAALVSTEVAFHDAGGETRARVTQTFRNAEDERGAGVYVFPLPEHAALGRLTTRVGARRADGRIIARGAPLDEARPNVFTARVDDVGPQQTVVIEFEYRQRHPRQAGRARSRLAL